MRMVVSPESPKSTHFAASYEQWARATIPWTDWHNVMVFWRTYGAEASSDKRVLRSYLVRKYTKPIIHEICWRGLCRFVIIGLGLGNGKLRILGGEQWTGFGFCWNSHSSHVISQFDYLSQIRCVLSCLWDCDISTAFQNSSCPLPGDPSCSRSQNAI
jgi:hypothetical protein